MRGSLLKRGQIPLTTLALCSCHPKKASINLFSTKPLIENSKKSFSDLSLLNKGLLFLLGIYRTFGSTFLGGNCRFEPSCSAYAVDAVQNHSFFPALKLILLRLSKCHPWGPYGYDPVPEGAKDLVHE